MPIVIDPSFVPPPPAQVVASPDGLLQVKLDESHAGVLLRADLSSLSPVPLAVRFYRNGVPVRGGDPAVVPGGVAHAYDHEAPIGEAASYWVQPVDYWTMEPAGDPSDRVTVELPWTGDPSDVWIKNPIRPDLSLRLPAATFEEQGRPQRTTFADVAGASLGVSAMLAPTGGLTATLTVKSDTKSDYDALRALFDGSILLVQAHPDRGGVPQMYARPSGDLTSQRRVDTGYGWGMRHWPLQLTECRRPATLDSPMRMPQLSWVSTGAIYPTWAEQAAQVASWDELIWGAV